MTAEDEKKASPGISKWGLTLALLLLLVAIAEVVAHFSIERAVVPSQEWTLATELVKKEWRAGDVVVAAPSWADPLLRAAMGNRLSAADVGHGSLEGIDRIWVLSMRGATASPRVTAGFKSELDESKGLVRVRRFVRTTAKPLYDFVVHVNEARVLRTRRGVETECPRETIAPEGGGLGSGPVKPSTRFACDRGKGWAWVGATVIEDLEYMPRRCIWQPALGKEPLRTELGEVPLGTRLALAGGLYLRDERARKGTPIEVVVFIDGAEAARFVHRDGDGWKSRSVDVPPALQGKTGTVSVAVSSANPKDRGYCWSGATY